MPPGPERARQEALLDEARAAWAADPEDPDKLIWVGRRLGYLWRMREAIAVYTEGLRRWPDYAPLYRHRGHRYISLRQFDRAIADLERAAQLIRGRPDVVEPDGLPNSRGVPLTTLGFNVWYHLGLARYLRGDFEQALAAWRQAMDYTRGYDDNRVAVLDWMYMTLRRLGRDAEAAELLEPVRADMDIIENHAYHRRLLMYKGLLSPQDLLASAMADAPQPAGDEARTPATGTAPAGTPRSGPGGRDTDIATYGCGVGTWYLYTGQRERALELCRQVVAGPAWPAFGFIAAEVELRRFADGP